jgi:hypothetical protein
MTDPTRTDRFPLMHRKAEYHNAEPRQPNCATVMPWQLVDPKYYAGHLAGGDRKTIAATPPADHIEGPVTAPSTRRTLWYRDTSAFETGELLLEYDAADCVTWFQLSHVTWPLGKEYVAEWRAGGVLQVGEVDSGEYVPPSLKMSPTIRRFRQAPRDVVEAMVDYFLKRAEALKRAHREGIAAILWQGLQTKSS